MTEASRVTNNIGSGTFQIHTARFDPDDSTIVYCLTNHATTNNLLKLRYVSPFTSYTNLAPSPLSINDARSAGFRLLPGTPYVVFNQKIGGTVPAVQFLDRASFQIVYTVEYMDGRGSEFNAFLGFEIVGSKHYFGRLESMSLNFQTYYFETDTCLYRDKLEVCTQCAAGKYRNSLLAGGVCLLPSEFAARHGIDATNVLMKACTDSNCLECLSNFDSCSTCDSTYFRHTADNKCYNTATMPVGFGPNTGNSQTQACSVTFCKICNLNPSLCQECNSGYFYDTALI